MSDILPLLTSENARKVAEDVISALEEHGNKSTIDFDFKMKEGKMERSEVGNEEIRAVLRSLHGCDVPAPNTWFSFDTKLDSLLGFIKDTICAKMDADTITDAEFEGVQNFIPQVIKHLNQDQDLVDRLRGCLRKVVLNNTDDPEFFPLRDIRTLLFEFGAKEDYGDMIKVFKYARISATTGKFTGEKNAVAKDLIRRRREIGFSRGQNTKEIYDQIVREQREAQNPLYAEVLPEDIEILSEAKECHLDLFADYSPLTKDEIVAKVMALGQQQKSEVE